MNAHALVRDRRGFFTSVLLLLLAITLHAAPARADDAPVKVRAIPQTASVQVGSHLVVAIEMDLGAHYHAWPAAEVKLPDAIAEFAIRTTIGWPLDEAATEQAIKKATEANGNKPLDAKAEAGLQVFKKLAWITRLDGVQYPAAAPGKVSDPTGDKPTIELPVYSGKAVAFARFVIADNAPLGEQTLEIRVYYQACNESTCLPPEDLSIPVKVKIVPKTQTDLGTSVEPTVFKAFDETKWGKSAPDPSPTPITASTPKAVPTTPALLPSTTAAVMEGNSSIFGFNLGHSIFLLALASILGGFLLNLTPCVLPVIPIKVLTLTKHATSKSHALVLGLWMAAGVVAFWTAIGLPMALISRELDPAQFIFGVWWVTFGLGLLIALMGLGIMGLFTLNLPQSVYMVEAEADNAIGSFLFGVLTAVLGLPCFGFFAGGLLGAAATLPAGAIMTVFIGLGVGMAAPYLILSVYPQLLKFIPKSGPAGELLKQVMGILLIAAAAYFITAGIKGLLSEYPYVAGSIIWWAVGFFITLASVWMTIRILQIARTTVMKLAIPMLAIAMTAVIVWVAQGQLKYDRTTYFERQAAMAESHTSGNGEVPAGIWLDYTPELFAAVRASGRPVFLDFTADWCITCKALKAAILNTEPVKSELKRRGVVLLEVDCTVRKSVGSKKLTELGRTGVPTWVLYGPGNDMAHFIQLETPTSTTVLTALDAAGIKSPTATAAGSGNPLTPSR